MPKLIDVFSNSLSLSEEDVRGKTVIIVDVLRATSTILAALSNGAKSIIPVDDMGEAGRIAQSLGPAQCLLCGERDGNKIEGYDLGNSPLEYTPETIKDKTLIFTTTNGTRAIARSTHAERVLIAGFQNARAVANEVKNSGHEVIIVCAGWKGRLSLEDMLCAGYMINVFYNSKMPVSAKDGAKVAMTLYNQFKDDLLETVSNTNHAKRLQEMGYGDDISYCCALNTMKLVPELDEGIIRI